MHLAELPARRSSVSQARVTAFDIAFLITATLFVIGGSLFVLSLGSAHSSGQTSSVMNYLTDAATWLPAMAKMAGKYILLFLASILNSGLIVLLVQSLRTMDRKITLRVPSISFGSTKAAAESFLGKRAQQRREVVAIRESSPFLLSPVFR